MSKSIGFPYFKPRIFNDAAFCLNGNCTEQVHLQEILLGLAMLPRAYNKAVEVIEGEIQNAFFYAKTGVTFQELEEAAETLGHAEVQPEPSCINFDYLNDNDRSKLRESKEIALRSLSRC